MNFQDLINDQFFKHFQGIDECINNEQIVFELK